MPSPYTGRVDVRRFLILAGFHSGAYVEDTSECEITTRNEDGYATSRYVNPRGAYHPRDRDRSNRVDLEIEIHSDLHVENSLHKLDTVIHALVDMRAGLTEEARVYRERQAGGRPAKRVHPFSRARLTRPSSSGDALGGQDG
jgi:hypothetical protein